MIRKRGRSQETVIHAGRNVTSAGRDIINYHYPQGTPPSPDGRPGQQGTPDLAARAGQIWGNVPARNPAFTGRSSLLVSIHASMQGGYPGAVQALHGIGGVGKTQVAAEYAHLYGDDYDIIWWLNAEKPTLLSEQFAPLAVRIGCAKLNAAPKVIRRELTMALRSKSRWLLVFDNADKPDDIRGWLPGRHGHVIITSRSSTWTELAVPVEVPMLARADSVAILRRRVPGLSAQDAEKISSATGDLPLAVAQAASTIGETAMPPASYLKLLDSHAAELLGEGKPATYPSTLAAVTGIAYDRLRTYDEVAADLAAIFAFMAPDHIFVDQLTAAAGGLPDPLGQHVNDPIALSRLINRLTRSALVQSSGRGLIMHRLTQAIIRGLLTPDKAAIIRRHAELVMTASSIAEADGSPMAGAGDAALVLDGRWMIIRRLAGADSGDGPQWLVRDRLSASGDSYAMKTIRSGEMEWNSIRSIQLLGSPNERRLAGVRGDHIGEVLAYGEDRGLSYLVYPLYRPGSLGTYVQQTGGRLTLRWSAQVILDVLDGLITASEAGFVHLDVKPSNIALDGEQARVVGWGLSRAWNGGNESTWVPAGTPFFASPEQLIDPQAQWESPRADLYGVGATFYWLLSGQPPLMASSKAYDLLSYRNMLKKGARPERLHRLVNGVPRALSSLIDQWLSPDPGRRVRRGTSIADSLQSARDELAALLPSLPDVTVGKVTARRRK